MLKTILSLILILAFAQVLLGDVAPSYSGTAINSTGSSVGTLSLTTFTVSAGSNLCLIAALGTNGTSTITAFDWDAAGTPQALTAGPILAVGSNKVYIYYRIAPTAGNLTLTASWTTNRAAFIGAVAFKNTDQTTCITTPGVTNNGSGTTATVSVTGSATGATVGVLGAQNTISSTDLSAVEVFRGCTSGIRCAMSYYLGVNASPNVHQWTMGSAGWVTAGVHVLPDSAAVRSCQMTLLGVGRC